MSVPRSAGLIAFLALLLFCAGPPGGPSAEASEAARQALYEDAVARARAAEAAIDGEPAARRRALVDLAAALKALRFAEAEARLGKAAPPLVSALRPGQPVPPDVGDVAPGPDRVALADVGDIWFAYRLDRAETALLAALDALGAADGAAARLHLAMVGAQLDALTRPPAAWRE